MIFFISSSLIALLWCVYFLFRIHYNLEEIKTIVEECTLGNDIDEEWERRKPCAMPDQLLGALHDKMHQESDNPRRVPKNKIRTVKEDQS